MENRIKEQFPIFKDNNLCYLDSASTSQKPKVVIDRFVEIYSKYNSNVHRGMYPLAVEVDRLWQNAHFTVSKYINAKETEVFFVKNATEGLNTIALMYSEQLKKDDVIVVSIMEHHSNYLPWLMLSKKIGCKLEILPLNNQKQIDINALVDLYTKYGDRIKIVSVVHTSNVLGVTNDITEITKLAHRYNTKVVIDGTQSIVHQNINVVHLDCDFFVFSGHKIYGPNGVGVVYAKEEILNSVEPVFFGGEMVESVSSEIKYVKLPYKFEAGTPNIADGITLATALDWFSGVENRFEIEKELSTYIYSKLQDIPEINIFSPIPSPVISFNLKNIHPHDVVSDLGEDNICVRGGYHCAQPLHEKYGLNGTVRASLGIYNTKDDIDRLINGLKKIIVEYE